MKLNTIISGQDSTQPPVILAHGLFGSARNLGMLARRLEPSRKVISVDMRNHGDSPWDDDQSYAAQAADLAEIIADHGGRADVVGHSMGGKAAMALALTQPDRVRRLVVLDIAPVSYDHSQDRLTRIMQDLDLSGLERRSQADKRLAERVRDPGVRAFLLQSLDLKSDPPRWQMNLAALEDQMPCITGWPDALDHAAFDGPVLALAGAESDYVAAGAPETALRSLFPQVDLRRIPNTSHWLHGEKPQEIGDLVAGFLNQSENQGRSSGTSA